MSFMEALASLVPKSSEEPITPVVPVEPIEPIEPIITVDPIIPVDPIEPVAPIEPIEPVIPIAPTVPDEKAVIDYLKSKGLEIETFEDLKKVKEVEKIVNPWDGVIDPEDEQYLTYKKENPGRTRKDFEYLNTDFTQIDPLVLARERARNESGQNLTDALADQYLARKLNIDLDDPKNVDELDKIELSAYAKPLLDQKISDKEKYRQPIEPAKQVPVSPKDEMVELTDGTMMKKAAYDVLIDNHQKHVEQAKASVDSVAEANFKVTVDDNGTPREINIGYEYSKEDKHSMLSTVSNVDAVMQKTYRSENGFNHKQFAEDMFWSSPTNREKAITSIINSARADAIEELMKVGNNVDYVPNGLPNGTVNPNVKVVPVSQLFN